MTRAELLGLVVAQARSHGFGFRRWYTARLELPWGSTEEAIERLATERRYYALLFSADFAQSFWKAGTEMTVQVEPKTFSRVRRDGSVLEVRRPGYLRRRLREDAWRFHLKEMSQAEEPLRYVRRFLRVEEDLEPEATARPIFIVDEEDLLPEDEE